MISFHGKTVAVVASGPSLTLEDCEALRVAGIPTVAVNTSWRAARHACVIYAGDEGWWKAHIDEIDIDAERWTSAKQAARRMRLHWHVRTGPYNSGMRAVQLAMDKGAKRIILLGFDCSLANGIHWHGPHTKTGNPRPDSAAAWQRHFAGVAAEAKKRRVTIVNCSRYTALKCFARATLESELERCGST